MADANEVVADAPVEMADANEVVEIAAANNEGPEIKRARIVIGEDLGGGRPKRKSKKQKGSKRSKKGKRKRKNKYFRKTYKKRRHVRKTRKRFFL